MSYKKKKKERKKNQCSPLESSLIMLSCYWVSYNLVTFYLGSPLLGNLSDSQLAPFSDEHTSVGRYASRNWLAGEVFFSHLSPKFRISKMFYSNLKLIAIICSFWWLSTDHLLLTNRESLFWLLIWPSLIFSRYATCITGFYGFAPMGSHNSIPDFTRYTSKCSYLGFDIKPPPPLPSSHRWS